MRHFSAWFLILALLCGTVSIGAADTKHPGTPPNQIDMPFLIAPANQGETLVGYHYMSYRLVTPSPADAAQVRLKLAFVQDAFVREVYRATASQTADPTQVDKATLHDRLIAAARRIVGAKKVTDLVFLEIKFAPLHPRPGGGIFGPETAAPGSAAATGPKDGADTNSKPDKKKDGKP